MNIAPTKSNKLKVNRPINRIPGAHQRPSEEPRSGNSLRVIPILLPQPQQLTQEQLGPARQRNPISKTSALVNTQSKPTKPIKQIPKKAAKPNHKKGANRLEAPYAKPNPTKPGKPSSAELKKQKQEMLDWLNNVRIG